MVCSDATAKKTKVGKREGHKIYELFVTNRSSKELSAVEVISLYCGRGGFEKTLSEEDQEQEPDRWCSGNGYGQEFWQIISQWLWNARLRMGFAANKPEVRRTLWYEGENKDKVDFENEVVTNQNLSTLQGGSNLPDSQLPIALIKEPNNAQRPIPDFNIAVIIARDPLNIDPNLARLATAKGHSTDKFAGTDFHLQPDGTVKCPAGKIMKLESKRTMARYERIIYEARWSDCSRCSLIDNCLHKGKDSKRGRNFSICLPLSQTKNVAAVEGEYQKTHSTSNDNNELNGSQSLDSISNSIYWDDLPATNLRRFLPGILRLQQVEIELPILAKTTLSYLAAMNVLTAA